jgi:glycosyltransferase involved in cell wall biosynthesis
MDLMYNSPYIKFERFGDTWIDQINHVLSINDVDISKVATYEIIPNTQLRDLYALTDIGVFPNRCEGGTNLVLMEYMACGRPVIASYTSGHTDILTDENSFPLKLTKPFRLYDNNNNLWADWKIFL